MYPGRARESVNMTTDVGKKKWGASVEARRRTNSVWRRWPHYCIKTLYLSGLRGKQQCSRRIDSIRRSRFCQQCKSSPRQSFYEIMKWRWRRIYGQWFFPSLDFISTISHHIRQGQSFGFSSGPLRWMALAFCFLGPPGKLWEMRDGDIKITGSARW